VARVHRSAGGAPVCCSWTGRACRGRCHDPWPRGAQHGRTVKGSPKAHVRLVGAVRAACAGDLGGAGVFQGSGRPVSGRCSAAGYTACSCTRGVTTSGTGRTCHCAPGGTCTDCPPNWSTRRASRCGSGHRRSLGTWRRWWLAVFAELERRLIGERTKAALAVKKAQGIKLGRPRTLPADVVERIRAARAQGVNWSARRSGQQQAAAPLRVAAQRAVRRRVRDVRGWLLCGHRTSSRDLAPGMVDRQSQQ
jgi:hypothetical protein